MRVYYEKRNLMVDALEQAAEVAEKYDNVAHIRVDDDGIVIYTSEWRNDDEEVSCEME